MREVARSQQVVSMKSWELLNRFCQDSRATNTGLSGGIGTPQSSRETGCAGGNGRFRMLLRRSVESSMKSVKTGLAGYDLPREM